MIEEYKTNYIVGFILAIEPLAAAIKNGNIGGIKIGGKSFIIGQYADDTFLLLDGREESLRAALRLFRQFYLCSGLRMNMQKTCAVWVGKDSLQKQPICEDLGLQWCRTFQLLGITFDVDHLDNMLDINLERKMVEMDNVLRSYKRRNLTIIGKITVIKTMVVSKLIHVLSVLPTPSKVFLQRLNAKFAEFIWNNKTGKISRNLLAQDMNIGGLKMTDVETLAKALKINWVKNIIKGQEGWADIFRASYGNDLCSGIWQLDSKSLTSIAATIVNPFWKNIIEAWASVVGMPESREDVLNTTFWHSTYMNNYNILQKQHYLVRQGCILIRDLTKNNHDFLTQREFEQKFNVRMNFLDYLSLRRCIPKTWVQIMQGNREAQPGDSLRREGIKTCIAVKSTEGLLLGLQAFGSKTSGETIL